MASNRLDGVKVTCYEKRTELDIYEEAHDIVEVWNAADYDQVNPVYTGSMGEYAWDVPNGLWQVRAEKAGYESASSDWMMVPPPQLDVNLNLINREAPAVAQVSVYPDAVEITFTRYMETEQLAGKIVVLQDGAALNGTVTWIDAECEPNGERLLVSRVRFVPADKLTVDAEVSVCVDVDAISYAGTRFGVQTPSTAVVHSRLDTLVATQKLDLTYGGSGVIMVTGSPAAEAAGKRVQVKHTAPMFIDTDATEIVLD